MQENGEANSSHRLVALEEHYADPLLDRQAHWSRQGPLGDALMKDDRARIEAMDACGIAIQVLSLAPPALQGISTSDAPQMASEANDRLAARCRNSGERLAGFATLPTSQPKKAADELRRAVEELGLVGAMIHGPTGGLFMDAEEFRPILKMATQLGVPLYLHPADPLPEVRAAYYDPYATTHPMFLRAGWGFTVETGTHAMRLVLGNIFDECPDLQIILGHLGEGIPFLLDRIDEALGRDTPMKNFAEVFRRHFHVTTSGFFSDAALACCLTQLGPDRVMFSIDLPFASAERGTQWFAQAALDPADRDMIGAGNARRLLGLGSIH